MDADERTVRKIYLKMYEEFIEGVDGNDNGVNVYDTDAPAQGQYEPARESETLKSGVGRTVYAGETDGTV